MSEKECMELKNALASTRMEGYMITEQTEHDCARLMLNEISIAELVQEILSRPAMAV